MAAPILLSVINAVLLILFLNDPNIVMDDVPIGFCFVTVPRAFSSTSHHHLLTPR
jgi:hypothetical protein